mgnify:CR=1|tara:strand:+ start:2145 stop:2351 length:207 start_codon:yes stop_codon:yes gene_type:complete
MNRYVIVWFFLGIIWAWGLIAIVGVLLGYNKDVADMYYIEQIKIPNAINTVETIPVEVYKLERNEDEL